MTNTIPRIQPKNPKPYWLFLLASLILLVLLWVGAMKVINWTNTHEIIKQRLIKVETHWPLAVKAKDLPQVIEKVIQPATPEEVDTPIKKYACDLWAEKTKTDAYCLTMVAVFQAESGWDNNKYNYNTNSTLDWGIAQINEVNWKIPGCSIIDIVIPDGNIQCAYKIWDRADGKEGDGKGSFTPWVAYWSEAYLAKL